MGINTSPPKETNYAVYDTVKNGPGTVQEERVWGKRQSQKRSQPGPGSEAKLEREGTNGGTIKHIALLTAHSKKEVLYKV